MERRSTLKRTTPLKAKRPLKRKTALKAVNRKRRDEAWLKGFGSEERVDFVRGLPCVVCGSRPSENHHVRSRGAGGTYREIVPLCHADHERYHRIGKLALLQSARKARWFAPLLVWDASMNEGGEPGMWREAESWEGAAELVEAIWQGRDET